MIKKLDFYVKKYEGFIDKNICKKTVEQLNNLKKNYWSEHVFYNPSLKELKKDINPFEKSAMDILNRTEIVSYKLDSGVHDDVTLIGFIAENTPAELATEQHDKMDNTNTLSVILKAIQEIDNRIIALQNKKNAIR